MKIPVRLHRPERHPIHHSFCDFSAAIDREAPDDELLDILEKATHPVQQNEERTCLTNCPRSLPVDFPADAGTEIIVQDFQGNLKTTIQNANALLSINAPFETKNYMYARTSERKEVESENILTIGSTYNIPVMTNPSKTTARSDTHINEKYETLEKLLNDISFDDFSTVKSDESTSSIAESTGPSHVLTSTFYRRRRRGQRPQAATQGA